MLAGFALPVTGAGQLDRSESHVYEKQLRLLKRFILRKSYISTGPTAYRPWAAAK